MISATQGKRVVSYSVRASAPQHEVQTNQALARWLARIQGLDYAGDFDPEQHAQADLYLVPTQTLIGLAAARTFSLGGPEDLFGGFAEYDFIATKAVTHGLIENPEVTPEGWSPRFAERAHKAVLDGYSVFSKADARVAAIELLHKGPVRLKPIHASAGRGQQVLDDLQQLEERLADADAEALFSEGVVLEEDLQDVVTHSVGQIRVGDITLSYCGEQYLTEDNLGEQVYGGSELLVVRGDYQQLLGLLLEADIYQAIELAQAFDAAADAAYPAFFASRRNYDIVRGRDSQGEIRSGVLEQSWRMGGASSAELAALEAFAQDPTLNVVRASSVESYRADTPLPEGAIEVYRGPAEQGDFLLKYAKVQAYDGKQ